MWLTSKESCDFLLVMGFEDQPIRTIMHDSRSALDLRKVPLSPIHPDIANDTYIHRFQSQVSSLCL
ncbi:uncharacterized protein PHALS_07957 [Plasmopara halstedii]|uniref:Uncharacterized protein n=1 Tax=Plasmopara halstedii TaxID=4781 RepID=A0A0P1B7A3_PLAHL|nr:uncharacterized protein PHALS_07957 [Plasmopara halstedii]CEG50233.1 hypothetical protein PHALS_07957 [Plasmopara halstedii]|eukprot:XP_024586602.1 hypothetical protein PHALS_07957 [Plasmopara halstedii]